VLCILAIPILGYAQTDAELARLTSNLRTAKTQADMNVASGKLAQYWDQKLAAIEAKVELRLYGRERKDFIQSRDRWRSYRSAEVAFRASLFDGGSIQPLIANTAYSLITEHRVNELESLFSEALSGRAERGGAANAAAPHR
jgi:uncharacterized protein YecT (DUF1311 family)